MIVIQLSDLHLRAGRAPAFNAADSATALERTVAHLAAMTPRPDLVIITGDIAEGGEEEAYKLAKKILAGLPCPYYVLPGNHDNPAVLRAVLQEACPAGGADAPACCYALEGRPMRLLSLSSIEPGYHGGALSPEAAAWLERTLDTGGATRDVPTLLFTHHPPFLSALGLMDEPYGNAALFASILSKNPQVRLCCGHLHRGLATLWGGVLALCCPPQVMHIVSELTPQGGDEFRLENPGYHMHHFFDGRINSHFCRVPGDFTQAGPYRFSAPPRP